MLVLPYKHLVTNLYNMIRNTYATFIKCTPPPQAISIDTIIYKLPIDLKKAFHHTYIDTHGIQPKSGTNPIYDEYEQLLANSDELRFLDIGIADNTESKIRESGKLGRGIARFILAEYYGYKYFSKIQNLLGDNSGEYQVQRKADGGSTPDWLISDDNINFCLGEAKGTHSEINLSSDQVNDWRAQCNNIVVKKGGKNIKLKSWLIATRFVTESEIAYKPEQLIEDPETDGEQLNENEYNSCNFFIAKKHIVQNLIRTSNFQLAIKLNDKNAIDGKIKILTWVSIISEFSHIEFIGRPINESNNRFYNHLIYDIENSNDIDWSNNYYTELNLGYFDGMALQEISRFIDGVKTVPFNYKNINLDKYPFISFLNDGSILIPMSLMKAKRVIEV